MGQATLDAAKIIRLDLIPTLIRSRVKTLRKSPELTSLILHILNIVAVLSEINRWY
jgi:hypothetical protein